MKYYISYIDILNSQYSDENFITGIAGFLGSHLADDLLQLGHEVIGVDNLFGGDIENINSNVDFHNADC